MLMSYMLISINLNMINDKEIYVIISKESENRGHRSVHVIFFILYNTHYHNLTLRYENVTHTYYMCGEIILI